MKICDESNYDVNIWNSEIREVTNSFFHWADFALLLIGTPLTLIFGRVRERSSFWSSSSPFAFFPRIRCVFINLLYSLQWLFGEIPVISLWSIALPLELKSWVLDYKLSCLPMSHPFPCNLLYMPWSILLYGDFSSS